MVTINSSEFIILRNENSDEKLITINSENIKKLAEEGYIYIVKIGFENIEYTWDVEEEQPYINLNSNVAGEYTPALMIFSNHEMGLEESTAIQALLNKLFDVSCGFMVES